MACLHGRTLLRWAVLVMGVCSPSPAQLRHTQPFSVKDSIEMTTFSDPFTRTLGAEAKESPNGSAFIVVTTHGDLRNNQLESSIWIFRRAPLESFVRDDADVPPRPRLLFRRSAIPEAEQLNSYGSLITNVQWSLDSRHILCLVEMAGGVHHLFRISVKTGKAADLTPLSREDIRAVGGAGTTVTFLQEAPTQNVRQGETEAETVLTGKSIEHILFPTTYPGSQSIPTQWRLHCLSESVGLKFCQKASDQPYPAGAALTFAPALSPDGTKLISALRVSAIPSTWAEYRSATSTYSFDNLSAGADQSDKGYEWPWQFSLIDLTTGRTERLFDAPVSWTAGYGGSIQARWSPDQRIVLLTNTFLPISNDSLTAAHMVKPCSIALYEVSDRTATCVVENPFPERIRYLSDASFHRDSSEIIATWRDSSGAHEEIYVKVAHGWKTIEQAPLNKAHSPLRVILHQDLTVQPTLWVEEDNRSRLLWDPNPQLAQRFMAQGRLYEWTDQTGYRWRGALLIPPTPMPKAGYPLVIQTHGFGSEHEFMPDGAYTTGMAAQPLACSGIVVLQMGDRPDKHIRPPGQEADDAVRGIIAAIESLRAGGIVDDRNVGIIGFSRTHWYVERALEEEPGRFKAATLIDGIDQSYMTHMLFAVDSPMANEEHEGANGGPPFGDGLLRWLKSSVGFNLERIKAPVRLEAITPLSILGEWETYSGLRQLGKPVDFVDIPNGQHILQKPRDRFVSQQGDVDWFRFWLQGYTRVTVGTSTEYSRWRTLQSKLRDVAR